MHQRAEFRIAGLDCAEEVSLIERQLSGNAGVVELEFDVLNARLRVTFEDEETSPEEIAKAVSKTGMTAVPWGQPESESWWKRNGRSCLAWLAGFFLVAGVVLHALLIENWSAAFGLEEMQATLSTPLLVCLVYSISILAGGWFVAPKAWFSLMRLRPDMNLLMCVAVTGAIVLNLWFEAATVTFLFALALLLEHWSVARARNAISSLMEISPETACCLNPQDDSEVQTPVADVAVGTSVIVRPYEKIPLDGIVIKGESSVNQAPITGESKPVSKTSGDEVFAGTINEQSVLYFEVTKPSSNTTLARIITMVEDAQSRRAPSEQWVEKFARVYTPAMIGLAIAIAVFPPLLFSLEWAEWFYRALVVLVIACPCALVISTPVSIVSALAAAARNGVLIKGGRFLEAAANISTIAIDKTGTLTRGRPVVQTIVTLNGHTAEEVLQRAAAMEEYSRHPIALAILRRAKQDGIAILPGENYRILAGRGAEGEFDGRSFWIGSHRLMHEHGSETPEIHEKAVALEDAGHSVVAVGNAEHVCGLIAVADEIRSEAAASITSLKRLGVKQVVMLTGDNDETARKVAQVIGVDDFQAELLPEDKVSRVEGLKDQFGSVAMVGDGVNDAPALATANLGIAMGAIGTDTAIEIADIALMSDDLSKLPWLVAHARRTLAVIKQNIGFALGLKALFIVLTFLGAASLWMAIAADTGASLLVILNGMRLLKA